ncbi:MAG: zinc-ribbon domain-containing protein, partial [Bacteroidales bacterium]|nr:zinc-ribbon domain-containing protein [Bacteroidales bacterium]
MQGVTSQNLPPAPKTATSGSTGDNKVNDQCPVCHKEVSNNAPYCIHCGSKLGDPIRTNIAGPAGISKDSEKDRVNIADIIGKPSVSPV